MSLGITVIALATSGAAMASHVCAYVNDDFGGPNVVEGYKVGPGTGILHLGPYPTNGQGLALGSYSGGLSAARVKEGDLYVSNTVSENITHFIVNKTDCTLTVDTTLYPSGDTGFYDGDRLAITPDGSTMFVTASGNDYLYSHTIAADGSLGPSVMEVLTPSDSVGFAVSPDSETLVVAYPDIQQVCAYPILDGHLGTLNCQPTAALPVGVSIDPAGKCVYVGEANFSLSEVATFTLDEGLLGSPNDYKAFGPGINSEAVLVNYNNKEIYITNQSSAQLTTGSVAPDCKLTYKAIIGDGVRNSDYPGQIAQGKISDSYVVTGDFSAKATPRMGAFHAGMDGKLTSMGKFPFMEFSYPSSIVVVGSE